MNPAVISIYELVPEAVKEIANDNNESCYDCDAPGCECHSAPCDCDRTPCNIE